MWRGDKQRDHIKDDNVEGNSIKISQKNFVSHAMHFLYSSISPIWLFGQYFGTKKCDLYSNKYGQYIYLFINMQKKVPQM